MRWTLLVAVTIALVSCGSTQETSSPREPGNLEIETDEGPVNLEGEIADEPDERATGLMNREELAPYDGMAFVWEDPVHTTFWMKDTLIPLSIAFWDEGGRIVAILDMDPCEADPCPTSDPGEEFVGAVEVRQGLLSIRGVEVGDHVELASSDR